MDGRKRVLKAHGASVNDSEYTWNVRLHEQFCNSSKYVVFLRIHILVNTLLCEIGYLYDCYHLKITLPSGKLCYNFIFVYVHNTLFAITVIFEKK